MGYGHVVDCVDCGRLSCGCARGNGRTARVLEILEEHGDVFTARRLYGEMQQSAQRRLFCRDLILHCLVLASHYVFLDCTQSVHIDLDNDEVSWPGSRGSSSRSSPDEELNSGGGGKSDRMSRGGDALFELGSPSARGQSGGGGDGGGGSGSRERAAFGGAPPAWPEEAAWRARRVMQATLFPEFETFDAVRVWDGLVVGS